MPTSSAGNRAEAGVTLIEMVVVVAIVGVIAAIVAPSMSSGLDSVRMASAVDNVATFLNSAVNRAERRQQAVMLAILPNDNKLAMYAADGFVREMPMPEGIRIEGVLAGDAAAGQDGMRLILMPGATIPGIGVQLVNQHKSRRIVRLDPMTGYPRVETPKDTQ